MKRFKINSKLRVLHVSTALSWRGGEQQLAYLIEELRATVDTFVLCAKGSKMEQFCIKNGVDHYCSQKRSSLDLGFALNLKRLCKKLEIDLCHLHDAHAHTFAILAASLFNNKTPLILSRRVDFPIKKNWFSHFKYNHKQIVKILCVSDTIKKITAAGIENKQKLSTVYSGIDLNKFKSRTNKLRKELNINEDTIIIGNTSAIADHKDYFTFVDVAEKLLSNKKNIQFLIIGDGPMCAEIEAYVHLKKLEKAILFTGFRNDIPEVLADLDIFFISSKTEGLGTSILDAFAAQVPVVGTAAGGIPELIEDNVTGKLCPVKDVDCLAESLSDLCKNSTLRIELAKVANKKVQQFSKQATAEKTFKHYQSVFS
ncbi:MAG: glycosyltransferase family 4 protein [Vicingaceae bacterium]